MNISIENMRTILNSLKNAGLGGGKVDTVTTIDSQSTDSQVPSAKSVYVLTKNLETELKKATKSEIDKRIQELSGDGVEF